MGAECDVVGPGEQLFEPDAGEVLCGGMGAGMAPCARVDDSVGADA